MTVAFTRPKDGRKVNQESHAREHTDSPPDAHESLINNEQKAIKEEEGNFDEIYDDKKE